MNVFIQFIITLSNNQSINHLLYLPQCTYLFNLRIHVYMKLQMYLLYLCTLLFNLHIHKIVRFFYVCTQLFNLRINVNMKVPTSRM